MIDGDAAQPQQQQQVNSNSKERVRLKSWKNRNRVLIFSSRGIPVRVRHLMNDLRSILSHSKSDVKLEAKEQLSCINDICDTRNCQQVMFFQSKKKRDAYCWLSYSPNGPSIKFALENIHSMSELKLTGNCLRSSRPVLSFSSDFDKTPQFSMMKEMLLHTFNTPYHHPKSQPFVDHVMSFTIADDRIWFRNYQIIEEDGQLVEIGPRFTLHPIYVFQDSFHGKMLWKNPMFTNPNVKRRMERLQKGLNVEAKVSKLKAKEVKTTMVEGTAYKLDKTDSILHDAANIDASASLKKRNKRIKKRKLNRST